MKIMSGIAIAALSTIFYASAGSGRAEACVAMGQPKIKLDLGANGTGRAIISEYDCRMMIRKTNCIVGLRLSDNALSEAGIRVRSLRFINLADGTPVEGFKPTPNQKTTADWSRVMDGTWFGFSAVFGVEQAEKGGLAIEVSFSYDPSQAPQRIVQAFDRGHVGLAEGDAVGGIARGHMLEVVQIQGASLTRG